jgi:hypothetical protein
MLAEIHFLRLEALAPAAHEGPWENRFVAFPSAPPPAPAMSLDDKNPWGRATAPR